MIKKAEILCLATLASIWLLPVNFWVGSNLGMTAICAVKRCAWSRDSGDPPPAKFYVMVRGKEESEEVDTILLMDLDSYTAKNQAYSLRLIGDEGEDRYGDWKYKVKSEAGGYQVIEARHQDAADILESYRVVGGIVQPLSSRIRSAGYGFSSIPFGMLFAWVTRRMARKRLLARKRGLQ
ncbi:hypothetical protein [Ralstonia solanacearum]|uniref:hypothetical protein n=1 Tax=Ralstonia solanacearum TaxID=305 RepID=UPI000A5F326B|nr:hypothetical protein [Ralstonia solanacearum]